MTTSICDIWWADPALVRDWHLHLLNDAERGRREELRQESGKRRFTVAAALLRLVAAAHTGQLPAAVVVDRRCDGCDRPHGRPRIAGSDLRLSVSHSGGRVVLAATRAGPVGVDVEEIGEVDLDSLVPAVLAPDEADSVVTASDFYTYWTRKEAVVKATGDGLMVSLPQVRVTPPHTAPEVRGYAGRRLVAQMCDLVPGAGYSGAVAVLTPDTIKVREWSASKLLTHGIYPAGAGEHL
jgi:4'-phosphopantetheinyl transferase